MSQEIYNPIPLELPSVDGWKSVPIPIKEGRRFIFKRTDEPLVPLGPFSENDEIFTSSICAGEKNDSPYADRPSRGSLITIFVREETAGQLIHAQSLLPPRMSLVALDAYRPLEVQQAAFDYYFQQLQTRHSDWTHDQLLAETQKYVSLPSTNPKVPSPHNTGGAVDLVIVQLPQDIDEEVREIDQQVSILEKKPDQWPQEYRLQMRKIALMGKHAQQLNFGTPFDWGGEEATLNYFEHLAIKRMLTDKEKEALLNRRLLYNVMITVGFEPYQYEWWHYNSNKTQMGAATAGLPYAEYGAATLSPKNLAHEKMRRNHRLGSIKIFEQGASALKVNPLQPYLDAVLAGIQEGGDIRNSSWQRSVVISPS